MNDFYNISDVQRAENSLTATISFNAAHAIFKGHFPTQPVVPGVCMMYVVKRILEQELSKKIHLETAAQVKFLQLITPETAPVILELKWLTEAGKTAVTASLRSEKQLFKMNGIYGEQ